MSVGDPWLARRVVGGVLQDETVATSKSSRLEVVRRSTPGRLSWDFEQPTLTLVWLQSGFSHVRLAADNQHIDTPVTAVSNLGVVASNVGVQGEFETGPDAAYVLAFFDLKEHGLSSAVISTRFTFADRRLTAGLTEICRATSRQDAFFPLLLEGWALQTLSCLASEAALEPPPAGSTTLPPRVLRRVRDHVEASLHDSLSVGSLAAVAGYSQRHFTRAFRNSTGQTPHAYIVERRLERAVQLIRAGDLSMTQITHACGFGQPQRFSSVFRRAMGISPTEYARHVRAPRV